MAYLALYRRFRPMGFDTFIGQEHVVKILKNQIKTGKIGHAYLFCGARGTGKTSAAKIFARAINCLSPVDGSPCGECEVCRALAGPNMDVLEMDAASNNSVDDVREMRDKIMYPPVNGKYKVYIVDEVHMLSASAFNALLKTLEEPPAHAVFIFATTEVHKIPQTILSRCMRFDFKLISTDKLVRLVSDVFDKTGKSYEPAAVAAIARAGAGSARDALSIADMCSSYSEGTLTYNDVIEVLGSADRRTVFGLVQKIIDSDAGAALTLVDALASGGKNMAVLAEDVAAELRDLIVCVTAKNPEKILFLPEAELSEKTALAARCEPHRLLRLLDIFTSQSNAFRFAAHPRIVMETAVIRACNPDKDYDADALMSRVVVLERELAALRAEIQKTPYIAQESHISTPTEPSAAPVQAPVQPVAQPVAQPVQQPVAPPVQPAAPPQPQPAPQPAPQAVQQPVYQPAPQAAPQPAPRPQGGEAYAVPPSKLWGNVLRKLRTNGNAVLWTVCCDVRADVQSGTLTITVDDEAEYKMFTREDHFKTLSETAASFGNYTVKIVLGSAPQENAELNRDIDELKSVFGDALEIKD